MDWALALDSSSTITHELDMVGRLLLAAAAGAAVGFDREVKDRPAGLRTHMLTALAAAVFTILTFEIYQRSSSTGDPVRIIEAVTAGVAFLAAGAIIQSRGGSVKGLTTGAAMWMAGALGVACGAGYFVLAVVATALTVVILTTLQRLEAYISSSEAPPAQAEHRPESDRSVHAGSERPVPEPTGTRPQRSS
jgi:putative Mg2+ transporter-C (MgtC) family protein